MKEADYKKLTHVINDFEFHFLLPIGSTFGQAWDALLSTAQVIKQKMDEVMPPPKTEEEVKENGSE